MIDCHTVFWFVLHISLIFLSLFSCTWLYSFDSPHLQHNNKNKREELIIVTPAALGQDTAIDTEVDDEENKEDEEDDRGDTDDDDLSCC